MRPKKSKTIAEELREARDHLNMSQTELANKLGVSRNTISRWELGEIEPEHPQMLRLSLEHLCNCYISPEVDAELRERHRKLMAKMDEGKKRMDDLEQFLGIDKK